MTLLKNQIDGSRHFMDVRIYWENTDMAGIVYHAEYFRFLDRGRNEYLRLLGINQQQFLSEGYVFVLYHADVKFKKPAVYDDILTVETSIENIHKTYISLNQNIKRGEDICLTSRMDIAWINRATKRPAPLPTSILSQLKYSHAAEI